MVRHKAMDNLEDFFKESVVNLSLTLGQLAKEHKFLFHVKLQRLETGSECVEIRLGIRMKLQHSPVFSVED